MKACCLVARQVQRGPIDLDLRHLQDAGILVIGRLNWGWADGTGTLPKPESREVFTDAVAETINRARGVSYWHVGNEPNNRSEWPSGFELTPEYVADIYNEIRSRTVAPMGPPPLDPYFGPGSDNSVWMSQIWDRIGFGEADAVFLHAKTQTNVPGEVWSRAKFSDDPLRWQYLHLRTVETGYEQLPGWARGLPVFVTECNPQHLEQSGGALGWKAGNGEWVREAASYFRELREQGIPIAGVCFYRYELAGDQAPFGLQDKPAILGAIEEVIRES